MISRVGPRLNRMEQIEYQVKRMVSEFRVNAWERYQWPIPNVRYVKPIPVKITVAEIERITYRW